MILYDCFKTNFDAYTLRPLHLPYSRVWLDAKNTFYFEEKVLSKSPFSHCQDDTRLCLMSLVHFINILSKRFSTILYIYIIRGAPIGNVHAHASHPDRSHRHVRNSPNGSSPGSVFPINTL